MKNIRGLLTIVCLSIGSIVFAQYAHQISMNFGIGKHNINSTIKDAINMPGMGIYDNIGYSFFLNNHWALHTGFGIKTFQTSKSLTAEYSQAAIDSDNESYERKTKYSSLVEEQKAIMLMFPVSVEYYYPIYSMMDLYASAGVEVLIPQQVNYEVVSGEIETRAYYSNYDVELYNLPQHGLESKASDYNGDIKLTNSYSMLMEFGALFHLTKQLGLCMSGYFTYGLNDMLISSNKELFTVNGVYNGMLNSTQAIESNLLTYGAKLAISWKIPVSQRR